MPKVLELDEPYEIPGFITCEELLRSKQFIISKNFDTPHEKEPFHVMTMEQNWDFIELCVREIPEILQNRYHIGQ